MTPFQSRVKSSKIQAVKEGEDCSLRATSRLNRWLTHLGRRTARYWQQLHRIKHRRAGFRGFNPKVSGGNCRKATKFGAAGRPKPRPTAPCVRSSAVRRGSPGRGEGPKGGPQRPRIAARGQGTRGENRPRQVPAVRRGATRPRCASDGRVGWSGPSTGQSPARRPGPLPSLTVSAAPAPERDWAGTACRPPPSRSEYPRSHLRATPR